MKIDFFVFDKKHIDDLRVAIESAAKTKTGTQQRYKEVDKTSLVLTQIFFAKDVCVGDIARMRINDVPSIVSKTALTKPISLSKDEGIGEETAFLIDLKSNVLAIQNNRFGVSASYFGRYLELFLTTGDSESAKFVPTPVLRTDVAEALSKMKVYRKLTVALHNQSVKVTPDMSVKDSIDVFHEAPQVEITVSMGRKRGGLEQSRVKAWLTRFLPILRNDSSNSIEKLRVEGKNEEEISTAIDLMSFRLSEELFPPETEKRRQLSYSTRISMVKQAHAKYYS